MDRIRTVATTGDNVAEACTIRFSHLWPNRWRQLRLPEDMRRDNPYPRAFIASRSNHDHTISDGSIEGSLLNWARARCRPGSY